LGGGVGIYTVKLAFWDHNVLQAHRFANTFASTCIFTIKYLQWVATCLMGPVAIISAEIIDTQLDVELAVEQVKFDNQTKQINPLSRNAPQCALLFFYLSNARRFYLSMGRLCSSMG
jgi:hypothetical protein